MRILYSACLSSGIHGFLFIIALPVNNLKHHLDICIFEEAIKRYEILNEVLESSCTHESIANTEGNKNVQAKHCQSSGLLKRKYPYIKMKLICPVANHFIFCCAVSDLVLVDLITTRGISIFIEEHWIASYA